MIAITDRQGKPCAHLLESRSHDRRLIQQTKGLPPIRTPVVHPVDVESLPGAIEAANASLIDPILVGPAAKIRAAAEQINKLDIWQRSLGFYSNHGCLSS